MCFLECFVIWYYTINIIIYEGDSIVNQSNMRGKYQYGVIQTKVFVDGIGEIEAYGIELISQNKNFCVSDVSTDVRVVMSLVVLLNRNDVSPVHLRNIIEDFLGNF